MLKTLTALAITSVAAVGTAQAQNGVPNSSQYNAPQMQNGSGATTGQGQYNWKNDRAPGNPQVHDTTGNAGNTPPPAGGSDGFGRANSHTQE